jgi:large subunit ribosomal protein L2
MTRPTFEEITTDKRKPLLEPMKRSGRTTRAATVAIARRQTHYRISTSSATSRAPAFATIENTARRPASASCTGRRSLMLPNGLRWAASSSGPTRGAWATLCRGVGHHTSCGVAGFDGASRIVRSAGVSAQLLAKEGDYAQVRLPSGEVRRVSIKCMATIGQVSNVDHENQNLGKAGRARHMGQRPEVRGVAMTPRDSTPRTKAARKSPTGMPPRRRGQARDGLPDAAGSKASRLIVRSRHRKS